MCEQDDNHLAFVTTDDLIDELARRSNALVLAALMKSDELPEGEGMRFAYRGGIFTSIGMLVEAQEQLRAAMRHAPDGDE